MTKTCSTVSVILVAHKYAILSLVGSAFCPNMSKTGCYKINDFTAGL